MHPSVLRRASYLRTNVLRFFLIFSQSGIMVVIWFYAARPTSRNKENIWYRVSKTNCPGNYFLSLEFIQQCAQKIIYWCWFELNILYQTVILALHMNYNNSFMSIWVCHVVIFKYILKRKGKDFGRRLKFLTWVNFFPMNIYIPGFNVLNFEEETNCRLTIISSN